MQILLPFRSVCESLVVFLPCGVSSLCSRQIISLHPEAGPYYSVTSSRTISILDRHCCEELQAWNRRTNEIVEAQESSSELAIGLHDDPYPGADAPINQLCVNQRYYHGGVRGGRPNGRIWEAIFWVCGGEELTPE